MAGMLAEQGKSVKPMLNLIATARRTPGNPDGNALPSREVEVPA
jgi:hypothetical protein